MNLLRCIDHTILQSYAKTKRIIALTIAVVLLLNPIITPQLVYGYDSTDASYGDLEVTVPSGTSNTYTVTLTLKRTSTGDNYVSLDNTEQYLATQTLADGSTEQRALALDPAGWPNLAGSLSNIPAGATITVDDIVVATGTGENWGDYVDTFVMVDISSSDMSESVVLEKNSQALTADETTNFVIDASAATVAQNLTEDTFTNRTEDYASEDGAYSLEYLLNNYNIVSFNDIESTHIVGPIIAQSGAYRTGDAYIGAAHDGSDLVASDYSRGVSSYVGKLYNLEGNLNLSSLQLGYGFDDDDPDFIPPHFYTRATDVDGEGFISITEGIENYQTYQYVHLSRNGASFLSPNAGGVIDNFDATGAQQEEKSYTYQNDDFIDFDKLYETILSESQALLTSGSLEGNTQVTVIEAAGTTLELNAGSSYLIKDATLLQTVNLILPEEYDFFVNPWLPPTTISFEGATINPTTYDGLAVSQFPEVYINGEPMDTLQGQNGEYGEVGNKIIWNLPNVVTTGTTNRLVTLGEGVNIPGHIVAVNAEFWNINASGSWEGGNLNGAGIFADFHSGNMEMHMWPYGGYTEQSTYINLEVEKTFTNGDLSQNTFQFTLEPADTATHTALDELYDFPLTASTNDSGYAYFPALVFEQAVDYNFYVKEVIPADQGAITYDTTQYLVNVSVSSHREMGDDEIAIITYTSTCTYTPVDANGTPLGDAVDSLTFTNEQTIPATASYTFTKVNSQGLSLPGATFAIIDADPSADETLWETPLFTQGSDNTGTVSFEELTPDTTYYMQETVAPSGYLLPTGYWVLTIDEYGVVTTASVGGAPVITDNQVVNTAADVILADVTITKENQHGVGLEGAEFLVERIFSMDAHVVVEGGYSATYTSDAQGVMTFVDLPLDGVYRVTELVAPDGYTLPFDVNYWIIQVITDDTQESGYTTLLYSVDMEGSAFDMTPLDNGLVLLNMDVYVLPNTGGIGTCLYYGLGISCLALAWFVYRSIKKSEGR